MSNLFVISYITLWAIVTFQTYYIIQLGRKTIKQHEVDPDISTLVLEDHGAASGEMFPQTKFQTMHHGVIDIMRIRKTGHLIAFTSVGCDKCKLVYPLLVNLSKARQDLSIILLMDGNSEDIVKTIETYQISMPVVPIVSEDIQRLQTKYFPFIYYLSSNGVVKTKALINYQEQLDTLVRKGMKEAV